MTDITKLTHFIVDVDGTLTDSGLYFDSNGTEIKKFSSRDYVGSMAAHYIGAKILIVTGRENPATERRAKEMKVDYIFQYVKDKPGFIRGFMDEGPVTVLKVSGDLSMYYVAEGQLLSCQSTPNLCRTQLLVRMDEAEAVSYFLTRPIGNHHVVIPGRQKRLLEELLNNCRAENVLKTAKTSIF